MESDHAALDRLLVSEYAPATVLINDQYDTLYLRGPANRYLELPTGRASLNLLEIVRPGIALKIPSALHKAVTERIAVTVPRVQVKQEDTIRTVDITIRPLPKTGSETSRLFVVIFEEVTVPGAVDSKKKKPSSDDEQNRRIAELESELQTTRQNLQTTIEELGASNEELKSANEELQSTNEEVQSTNEELVTAREELQSTNEELITVQFAFIASHDLQEPLRKVQTFGNRIAERYGAALDDEGRDYLNRMTNAAKRMRIMIQALLDYSRVGTREKPFDTVDLTRLIGEIVGDFEVVMKDLGARVEVAALPTIEADSNQMRQLFQNLISNSLKFHGERKPVIKIYAEPVDGKSGASAGGRAHRICVEDNGIGFDEKHLERIFILFRRLHGRSAYEGTGIGLAICQKIVERHHGTITARSKPGEGATFIVTLPASQPAEA